MHDSRVLAGVHTIRRSLSLKTWVVGYMDMVGFSALGGVGCGWWIVYFAIDWLTDLVRVKCS